jgi:hypothetical protein
MSDNCSTSWISVGENNTTINRDNFSNCRESPSTIVISKKDNGQNNKIITITFNNANNAPVQLSQSNGQWNVKDASGNNIQVIQRGQSRFFDVPVNGYIYRFEFDPNNMKMRVTYLTQGGNNNNGQQGNNGNITPQQTETVYYYNTWWVWLIVIIFLILIIFGFFYWFRTPMYF